MPLVISSRVLALVYEISRQILDHISTSKTSRGVTSEGNKETRGQHHLIHTPESSSIVNADLTTENDGIPVPTLILRETIAEGYFPWREENIPQKKNVLETVVIYMLIPILTIILYQYGDYP